MFGIEGEPKNTQESREQFNLLHFLRRLVRGEEGTLGGTQLKERPQVCEIPGINTTKEDPIIELKQKREEAWIVLMPQSINELLSTQKGIMVGDPEVIGRIKEKVRCVLELELEWIRKEIEEGESKQNKKTQLEWALKFDESEKGRESAIKFFEDVGIAAWEIELKIASSKVNIDHYRSLTPEAIEFFAARTAVKLLENPSNSSGQH